MRNETHIQIKGARTRNLKNIDINIKLNAITCLYGPSGSGKSSLAFGTLVTESKRRFINSFPSDIKFFWDMPNVVDVDSIGPVLPVWSLAQNNPIIGSRPSVGDILGLTERFQSLFFACSKGHCSKHDVEYESKGPYEKIIDLIDDENETFHVFALKESYVDIVKSKVLPPRSFNYDSKTINSFSRDDEYWELFRFKGSRPERIKKQLSELSLKDVTSPFLVVAKGSLSCHHLDLGEEKLCPVCGEAEKDLGRLDFFSPYNALGACGTCQGHGMNLEYDIKKLIKNDELSIEEDAINFLNYKTFAYEKRYFLEEVKKKNGL